MRRVVPCLVGALLLCSGCAWFQMPFMRDTSGLNRGLTIDSLQDELSFFATNFAGTVSSTAEDISDGTTDRRVRRNALLWRLRMVPAMNRVAYGTDPRAGYVRALFIAIAQRQYLETGDGRTLFTDQQALAVEGATRLEADAVSLGERFLTQTEMRRVQAEVAKLVVAYPIVGREFSLQRASDAQRNLQTNDVFTTVLSIPLSPFRALEGVDSGAQAIREFNQTARRFTGIIAGLPEQVRGELELFLYDVESRETVVGGLAAVTSMAASADRLTTVAEALPEQLKATLGDAQGTIDRATQAVQQLQALAGPLDSAAGKLRDGSIAWREVIGSRAERDAGGDSGRPFDIREWESTATAIGGAADQLRGLAGDAQTLAGSQALDARLTEVIDRAFWRGAALIVLFFALLLIYRVIASWLTRPPAREPG